MKLKTIATLFKRNKRLVIYTAPNGEQWVCNGVAMYSKGTGWYYELQAVIENVAAMAFGAGIFYQAERQE